MSTEQPPAGNERKDQVRNLVLNLSRQAETLWGNQRAMARIRRYAPDRLEEFWSAWDMLDNRLRDYLDGRLSWSETREVPGEVTFSGTRALNPASGEWGPLRCRTIEYEDGPDVICTARAVFLLIFELKRGFAKEGGSGE
jgi:hypothetical protein